MLLLGVPQEVAKKGTRTFPPGPPLALPLCNLTHRFAVPPPQRGGLGKDFLFSICHHERQAQTAKSFAGFLRALGPDYSFLFYGKNFACKILHKRVTELPHKHKIMSPRYFLSPILCDKAKNRHKTAQRGAQLDEVEVDCTRVK